MAHRSMDREAWDKVTPPGCSGGAGDWLALGWSVGNAVICRADGYAEQVVEAPSDQRVGHAALRIT